MGLFSGKRKSTATVGLHSGEHGTALARVAWTRGHRPALLGSDFIPVPDDSPEQLPDPDTLDERARKLEADGETVNIVLDGADYQLLLVEAPEVDPDELRPAIRWRVKDLIDFHIDDAVFDAFAVPGQQNRPRGQRQMYAVAARARRVGALVERVEPTGLQLAAIDITELAMRNLAALLDADARGLAMLHFGRTAGVLIITRQHELYLARKLNFGTEELTEGGDTVNDQVLLEIQRSLDYYGSHFAQPAPVALTLLPGFAGAGTLAAWLDDQLDLSAEVFDITGCMDCNGPIDNTGIDQRLLAIGGALRREERTL